MERKRSQYRRGLRDAFSRTFGVLLGFAVRTVGGSIHKEYWIPAEELPEFNRSIVGEIEVVAEFR